MSASTRAASTEPRRERRGDASRLSVYSGLFGGFNGAASGTTRRPPPKRRCRRSGSLLQRSRVGNDAETATEKLTLDAAFIASTEPRRERRGDCQGHLRPVAKPYASTEPRRERRGDAVAHARNPQHVRASTEPRRERRGDKIPPLPRQHWHGSFNGAASGTTRRLMCACPSGSARWGFNGAASGTTRRRFGSIGPWNSRFPCFNGAASGTTRRLNVTASSIWEAVASTEPRRERRGDSAHGGQHHHGISRFNGAASGTTRRLS